MHNWPETRPNCLEISVLGPSGETRAPDHLLQKRQNINHSGTPEIAKNWFICLIIVVLLPEQIIAVLLP